MSCPICDDLGIEQDHPDLDPELAMELHLCYSDGDMSELNYVPDDEVDQ
jgi:hypothetical protein